MIKILWTFYLSFEDISIDFSHTRTVLKRKKRISSKNTIKENCKRKILNILYRLDTLHSTFQSLFSLSRLTDVELNFLPCDKISERKLCSLWYEKCQIEISVRVAVKIWKSFLARSLSCQDKGILAHTARWVEPEMAIKWKNWKRMHHTGITAALSIFQIPHGFQRRLKWQ